MGFGDRSTGRGTFWGKFGSRMRLSCFIVCAVVVLRSVFLCLY